MSVVGRVVILCRCVLCFLESTKLCIYVQPRSCAQVWVAPRVGLFPQCVCNTLFHGREEQCSCRALPVTSLEGGLHTAGGVSVCFPKLITW